MRLVFRRGLSAGLVAAAVLVSGSVLAAPAYGVAGGAPAPADGYGFVADVKVGNAVRGCSGALVDPEWIVTAKSCFAQGAAPVPVGPPVYPTTVTVGREDLATSVEGQVRTVSHVAPHAQRDLLLARLDRPVIDVAPVRLAATAPAVGEALQVAGFGRTGAEWVPDKLHVGAFAVQSVATATVTVTGSQAQPASVCKGDAGGPAVRAAGGGFELVALNGASWQAGCLGTAAAETRNGATETRLDNVRDWVRRTVRGGNFVRLATSAQVLNTLAGTGTAAGPRGGGSVTSFPVAGVGGIPTADVTAVLVDVTAVTAGRTHLTLYPDGAPHNPALSMVNADGNQTISNTAVVPVSANGKLAVFNQVAGTHVLVDVQGYFTTAPSTGGGFVPVDYTRLVDTRNGTGGAAGIVPARGNRTFTLAGSVIPAGTRTAFVDLIVTNAIAQGWVGAFPPGGTNNRSVMDYAVGTTSHAVAVQLDASGKATFTNNGNSAVHFVITAAGYFTTSATAGAGLRTMPGARRLDTRLVDTGAPVRPNATVDVALGVPAGTSALVNLTVFENTAGGFLNVWPVGGVEVAASLTNYPNAGPRSGLAVVRVGTDGKVRIRNNSTGTTHLVVDLQGWYAVPPGGDAASSTVDAKDTRGAAAMADTPQGTVEDYLYPDAERILAEQNARLISGDGHIVLADCATPPQGDIGLMKVYTTEEEIGTGGLGLLCFKVRSATGFLNLEVPGVYEIRGDGQRTGTGHEVTAELISDAGEEITVEVDPDGSTQVGVGADPDASPTMLLRLTANG
jgi:Trypsin